MIKQLPLLLLLIFRSMVLLAQGDTVSAKISRLSIKHVDVPAKFLQGDFKAYISQNLQTGRIKTAVNGNIVLLMTINADGTTSHVSALKSLSPQIDPEIIRVVNASPKWQPAMLNGEKTSMDMVLNIDIVIKGIKTPVAARPDVAPPTPPGAATAIARPATLPVKKPVVTKVNTPPAIIKPPEIVKKAVPVAVTKVTPVVVTKVTPVAVKTYAKPPVKKPGPTVVKKAVPAVAKTVIPIVKKTVLPVKIPAVAAKKVESPLIKKPVAAVTKKVEAPVKKPAAQPKSELADTRPPQATVVKKPKRVVQQADIFHPTSNDPEFPGGGFPSFMRYLGANIVYPEGSKKAGVEGKVILTFTVEADGSVSNVEVVSSPAEDLSQEAIRVLLASPKWKPGEQNGLKVPESYTLPIKFSLTKNN